VEIEELIATDARAEATLWRYVGSVDLFPRVSWSNAPVDGSLPWIVSDARRVRRRPTDTLWMRLDDVPGALAARRYLGDGTLRLAVADPPSPETPVYELRVEGGAAKCVPSRGDADLRLDRATLASLYLGAVTPSTLARAGCIAGDPAAVSLADRIFAASVAPWCQEVF